MIPKVKLATLAFSKHVTGRTQRLHPLHRTENLAIMELAKSGDQKQVGGEHHHLMMSIDHRITLIPVIK